MECQLQAFHFLSTVNPFIKGKINKYQITGGIINHAKRFYF